MPLIVIYFFIQIALQTGLAGSLAKLQIGDSSVYAGADVGVVDEYTRRIAWERGQIDYLGMINSVARTHPIRKASFHAYLTDITYLKIEFWEYLKGKCRSKAKIEFQDIKIAKFNF